MAVSNVQRESLNLQQPGTMGSGWRGQAGANFMARQGAGMAGQAMSGMMGMGNVGIPGIGPVAGLTGLLGQFDPAEIKQAVQELTAELPQMQPPVTQQGLLGAPLGAVAPSPQSSPLVGQELASQAPAAPPSGLRGPFTPNTETGVGTMAPETAMQAPSSQMVGDVPVPTPSPFKTAQGKDLWNEHPFANISKVDQRLVDAMKYGAWNSGTMIDAFSGVKGRSTGTTNHPAGRAVDVSIIDQATGQRLPNYQNAGTFRDYEKYAQEVRKSQMLQSPELNDALRWGGYFAGGPNPRDSMHLDISGRPGLGMAGGSWEQGATPQQLAALGRGAQSAGMGNFRPDPTPQFTQHTTFASTSPPSMMQPSAPLTPGVMPQQQPQQAQAMTETQPSMWQRGSDLLSRAKAEFTDIRDALQTAKKDIKKANPFEWMSLPPGGTYNKKTGTIAMQGFDHNASHSDGRHSDYPVGQDSEGMVAGGLMFDPKTGNYTLPGGMVYDKTTGTLVPSNKPNKPDKPHKKPFRYDPYSIAWRFPQYTQTWAFTPPRVPGYMG